MGLSASVVLGVLEANYLHQILPDKHLLHDALFFLRQVAEALAYRFNQRIEGIGIIGKWCAPYNRLKS